MPTPCLPLNCDPERGCSVSATGAAWGFGQRETGAEEPRAMGVHEQDGQPSLDAPVAMWSMVDIQGVFKKASENNCMNLASGGIFELMPPRPDPIRSAVAGRARGSARVPGVAP